MPDIQTTLTTATKCLTATSDSASIDAEVLLCHVLKKPRSHLRAWPEKQLTPEQQSLFQQLLEQRIHGTPVAYLTGTREFWSRDFKVNEHVLIPRPDTELLIELSLSLLSDKPNARIIDLGTGSGAIAITLAAELPDLEVWATDQSEQALKVAQENAATHQTQNIHFCLSNWFDSIKPSKFDLVISNPPYIDGDDPHLSQGDVRFEPDSALIAHNNGLKDIESITQQAQHYLKPGGTLLIEHGYDQQIAVQAIFNSFNYDNIQTHTDLSGNPRVTTGQWNP